MDINKKAETKSSPIDDIDKKIHANQVLYDQLHQSLVDEIVSKDDEALKKIHSNAIDAIERSRLDKLIKAGGK